MMLNKIKIIGVYPVGENKDVHLVEVLVDALPSEFDVGEFTQEDPSLPKSQWQVAYDEHYLDPTGTKVIGRVDDLPSDTSKPTRLAFFIYFLDFERPLLTPFGPVNLPPPTPMPDRLKQIQFEEPFGTT